MPQYPFGVGQLWFIPSGANPSPIEAGALQEVSLEIEQSTAELRGANKFPLDVRATVGKVGGKIKMAELRPEFVASVFGGSAITGMRIGVPFESTGTIAGATYTVANPTGFCNLGVKDEAGNTLSPVASAPAAGQYSVTAAGVYTFNATANGKIYGIRYSYYSATIGKSVPITNGLVGANAYYRIDMFNNDTVTGKKFGFTAYKAIIPKLGLPLKNNDFVIQDLDFQCMADESQIGLDGNAKVLDVYCSG